MTVGCIITNMRFYVDIQNSLFGLGPIHDYSKEIDDTNFRFMIRSARNSSIAKMPITKNINCLSKPSQMIKCNRPINNIKFI